MRPTSDRVRESLFSRLGDLSESRVLDLFCGTGSLGIEAISRGASGATFVDRSGASIRAVKQNVESLGVGDRSEIIKSPAQVAVRRLVKQGRCFDLVFADPPYDSTELATLLGATHLAELLARNGTLVVESATRHSFPSLARSGFEFLDERSMGETRITRLIRSNERDMKQDKENVQVAKNDPAVIASDDEPMIMRRKTIALFPASFDPITNGHLDLIDRASKVFDEVVVAVAINLAKSGTFSFEERVDMLQQVLGAMDSVRVEGFSGLVVNFAQRIGATVIIRGLRASSDFEYEFEMALMNRHLAPDIEILCMMTRQEYLYVSSSRLKELVRFGANVDEFVPEAVSKRLREKLFPDPVE